MKGANAAVVPANLNDEDQQLTKPTKPLLPDKPRWSRPSKNVVVYLVFVAMGALTLTTEMQVVPRWATFDPRCSPNTVDVTTINYRSDHRFYSMLKDMKTLSPPTFRDKHEALCTNENTDKRKFEYCLPITSQDDPVFCAGADRIDLLVRQSPLTLCRTSVMHLLLSDVYEELMAVGFSSSVNFAAVDGNTEADLIWSGAILSSSIAYTNDIVHGGLLDMALRKRGYHLFKETGGWRVCVAPTHPLASHLYDPNQKISNSMNSSPHIDLVAGISEQDATVTTDTIEAHPQLDNTCTPNVLDVKHIEYRSKNRFYAMLQTIETPPPPVFRGEHKALCNENLVDDKPPYCLPISARSDAEFCTGADRIDLLIRQSSLTLCLASILHMLVGDVFDELQAVGGSPIANLDDGNQGVLMEHTNIAYNGELVNIDDLKHSLRRKGYHLYYEGNWRVCVAPIHPLASNLYNPDHPALSVYSGPYLTLVPNNPPVVTSEPSTEVTEASADAALVETKVPGSSEGEVTLEKSDTPTANKKGLEETKPPTVNKGVPEETKPPMTETGCKPDVVAVVDDGSDDEFYVTIKTTKSLPAPRFHGEHEVLCNPDNRKHRTFQYCLPISGRKDTPFCANADRMDILLRQSPAEQCFASVLHMLLKDVYDELKAIGFIPLLTYGTLLGAVRDGGVIPFTEDIDIAYSGRIVNDGELDSRLWRKGYHLFHFNIWRVCVAPTHPLASRLYDPGHPIVEDYTVPYVDLYAMQQQFGSSWSMQELRSRRLPNERVVPFSQVSINNEKFDTVHDPDYLLMSEYGADYMTPKPRHRRLAREEYLDNN